MKILFDNNVPLYLLTLFPGASTAYREGWHALANGSLLSLAETAGFSLLITMDRGFETQQSLKGRSISVAILKPGNQSRSSVESAAQRLAEAIKNLGPGELIAVS
jgi:predicted nuclease of predicted toxin-antitoxin system